MAEGKGILTSRFPQGKVSWMSYAPELVRPSYGGARQFILLDIMLWLYMGCFGMRRSVNVWKIGGGICRAPRHEAVFGIFGKLPGAGSVVRGCFRFAKPHYESSF